MIVFNNNTMKTKNKKLLKTFDGGETTVYRVRYSTCAHSIYFNEKPNKKQLANIANKYFGLSQEEIDVSLSYFEVIEIKVFNLYSTQ